MKTQKNAGGEPAPGVQSNTARQTALGRQYLSTTSKSSLFDSFLIGSIRYDKILGDTCPAAKSLCGFSETLGEWVVIQIRCKRWGCRHCGQRKVAHYAHRCEDARPNRLITLTVSNKLWRDQRAAYEGTKNLIAPMVTKLRRIVKEFEYFKILEVTKKGWPHYHLVVRSPYIHHSVLVKIWKGLTGAVIVDVRKINRGRDTYFYVMKYLSKQHYVPWTNRRASWSKDFFPEQAFEKGPGLSLIKIGLVDRHPVDVFTEYYRDHLITPISKDCWTLPHWAGREIGVDPAKLYRKGSGK